MHDLEFIEACYEPLIDDAAWGVALAERISRLVPGSLATMAAPYEVRLDEGGQLLAIIGDERFMDAGYTPRAHSCMRVINASPDRTLLQFSYGAHSPTVAPMSSLPAPFQGLVRQQMPWPSGEYVGLFASLDGKSGYQLCPGGPALVKPSPRRHTQLTRLCEHVAAAYWLRRMRAQACAPSELEADVVFSPDGSVRHESPALRACGLREQFVDAVRAMDRVRCRRRKHAPEEATELWSALVAGQYALVESFERNGRRLILAVRCRAPSAVLTSRESAVARSAASGRANKQIAAELGLATSTVGVHLASALRKLGCPSRRLLAHWLPSRATAD